MLEVYCIVSFMLHFSFLFQAEDGIRDLVRSRGLGDVYKRQPIGDARRRRDPGVARRLAQEIDEVDVEAVGVDQHLSLIHI